MSFVVSALSTVPAIPLGVLRAGPLPADARSIHVIPEKVHALSVHDRAYTRTPPSGGGSEEDVLGKAPQAPHGKNPE